MNINNGKTGTVNIPGALHSTGGDGDGLVGNVVAYAGDIYDETIGANQREINAQAVKMDNRHNLSLGVGVVAQRSSFGFGSDSTTIYLTGNNKSYTATLLYDQGNTSGNSLFGDIFRTIFRGVYLLDYDGVKVAQITNASYDSDTQVITLTLDTDLGELNDQLYSLENVSGSYNFNAGAFGNKGGDSTCLGYVNMNRGDYSSLIGTTNSNSEDYGSLIGCYNRNDGLMGTVIGTYNTNKGDNSTVIGNYINFGENCTGSAVGSNINIYKGQNTGLNSGVSTAFAFGSGLTLSHPSIALGRNNKDYDISGDTQNFFTLGCGEGKSPLNLLEQSKNGNLFIKGIGNFDGTNSQSASTKSLQDVLDEIESGLQSAIKLNEYDEVNITYPLNEEQEGYILCNLEKDDEKIIQEYPGSDLPADAVRNGHFYIATNMGNHVVGILGDNFTGYDLGEEIRNVNDSNDKSIILDCFKINDYWVLETESELALSYSSLYSSLGNYYQTHDITPFRLEQDGSLYLMNVGGYNGDASTTHQSESLQYVLNQIASASGGVTSWNDLEDKPTILDSYDVRQIVLEKSPLHYDDSTSNYISYIPNGSFDAYTTNTVRNTYNGIVLGKYNTTSGNTSYGRDDSTVIVGKSNTNASKNSVLIGDSNNNNQNKSVLLGSTNINKSEGGVNIGYYNQNNGGERNVMVGYDNYALNSASTLCMGSENRLTMYSNNPASQEIIAIGRGLECNTGGIFLGYYNVDDYILTGDTANFLTIGDGSGNIYSSTRSNIIEQRRNGDIYIKGIGNYNGNNSRRDPRDPTRGKSLQEVISGISASTESKLAQTPNNSLELGRTNFVNNTSDSFAGGAGVNITGNRAFGYGISMGAIYLTGDEGTYSARLHSNSNFTNANNIGPVFATTHLNSYLLSTTDFSRVAKITDIVYNGENQPLTLTLNTDLGNLTNAVYAIENVAGTKSFNGGSFGNAGQNSSVIGQNNFNTGNSSSILGSVNANTAGPATVLGYLNKNSGSNSNILGTLNDNSATYSNVIGLQNANSGQYSNIVGRNNNNKCANTNILGTSNIVNETTYPSSILGFENNADATTQQFTLGYQNHGTRGQYAQGNVSASFMFGHNLTTSSGCYAIGKYNKDYDVQDIAKQNFFVVGQGDTNRPLNNLEVKNNGNWYVYGVGGFDGTNSDSATVKTLQAKIAELEARIAQLEGNNS